MKLLKSVGIQGNNLPSDIKTVQHSLIEFISSKQTSTKTSSHRWQIGTNSFKVKDRGSY